MVVSVYAPANVSYSAPNKDTCLLLAPFRSKCQLDVPLLMNWAFAPQLGVLIPQRITCIHDDILRAVDEKQCVILLLLDLSAAFDTIDHDMLLSRLRKYIGLRDTVLNWFGSYLSQRQQSVLINGVKPKMVHLSCGVPQGLVPDPILFTIYLLPLGDIIRKHGLKFHMYADDCQLYTSFSMSTNEAVSSMHMAINDIRASYAANML